MTSLKAERVFRCVENESSTAVVLGAIVPRLYHARCFCFFPNQTVRTDRGAQNAQTPFRSLSLSAAHRLQCVPVDDSCFYKSSRRLQYCLCLSESFISCDIRFSGPRSFSRRSLISPREKGGAIVPIIAQREHAYKSSSSTSVLTARTIRPSCPSL
jgi:hypothetical protein